MLASGTTQIRRLSLRSQRGSDTLSVRRAVEDLFTQTEIKVSSLASEATLCIRRLPSLAIPVPLGNRADPRQIDRLEKYLSNVVTEAAGCAAVPKAGILPANSDAVLFPNQAELLAALAMDWLRGEVANRWWWRTLFPGSQVIESLCRAWEAHPREVPTALEILRTSGHSGAFLHALPKTVCRRLAQNVACAFTVEESLRLIEKGCKIVSATKHHHGRRPESVNSYSDHGSAAQQHELPPWSEWVVEDATFVGDAQVLMVLSLMLIRAPAVVRSPRFHRQIEHFIRIQQPSTVEAPIEQRPKASMLSIPLADSISSRFHPLIEKSEPQLQKWQQKASAEQESARSSDSRFSTSVNEEADVVTSVPALERQQHGWRTSTELGGLFYLVNVALALGLYGDFSQPRHKDLPLPLWDFLALLGRRLIGPALEQDRAWKFLAQLSGRGVDEPPGEWLEVPEEWRVPAAWLACFPERTGFLATTSCNRMRLEHPAGFTVLDVPLGSRDRELELAEACATLGLERQSIICKYLVGSEDDQQSSFDRWTESMASYIRARLCRCLGETNSESIRELVFHHDAELRASSERVSVRFSLAEHPVILRLAGLDRDPGWLPSAGRILNFLYE